MERSNFKMEHVTMEKFKVTVEIEEWVEAASVEEAQQKFKDNFEWADIEYGNYRIELKEKEEA